MLNFVNAMPVEKQLNFVNKINEIELDEKEKRLILAGLRNETKEQIDLSKVDEKYVELLKMRFAPNIQPPKIIVDLDADLSIYEGIDELLYLNGFELSQDQNWKIKIHELQKICPDLEIIDDNLGIFFYSTIQEFIEGEQWIESVLEQLDPEWSTIQKIAYIHTRIGKRMSYTPEQGTEAENPTEERALWKIISKRYGVCNGISQLEKYLLQRVGVDSEIINCKSHSYLKINDIEIPTKDGVKKGNTLVDPTWDLVFTKYDGKTNYFCKNYQTIRKADTTILGDSEVHKKEKLENEDFIEIDDETLRRLYSSIGLADKEGHFPIKDLIDKVNQINNENIDFKEKIVKKIEVLQQKCPEYAKNINETIQIMKCILFANNENFNYNKCVASRVYDRNDDKKKAVLYTYFDLGDGQQMFYYADQESGEFINLDKEEFENKFECYENDLKRYKKRLWENTIEVKQKTEEKEGR